MRLTRRLIGLEVSDIDVPPTPDGDGAPTALFFRVLELPDGDLRIELWERGVFYGARRVSTDGTGPLRARRIGLVAGVLARRLRRIRLAELLLASQPETPPEAVRPPPGFPIFGSLALSTRALGAAVPGDLWLAGPQIAGGLRFDSGVQLELGLAWLAGRVDEPGDETHLSWYELSLTSRKTFSRGEWDFGFGATAALASVRWTRPRFDELAPPTDTWGARTTAHLVLEGPLGRRARWSLAPEIGASLHPLKVPRGDGFDRELGGLWVGGSVGIALDPLRRARVASRESAEAAEARETAATPEQKR